MSMNVELLSLLMHSHGLLIDQDLEVINTGPTGYHKNQLLLGYVRNMDDLNLKLFGKLLQEGHPSIKIPLSDGELIDECVCKPL